jgi:hypothetical protein
LKPNQPFAKLLAWGLLATLPLLAGMCGGEPEPEPKPKPGSTETVAACMPPGASTDSVTDRQFTFTLRVLDQEGKPKNAFRPGELPAFVLSVANQTTDTLSWDATRTGPKKAAFVIDQADGVENWRDLGQLYPEDLYYLVYNFRIWPSRLMHITAHLIDRNLGPYNGFPLRFAFSWQPGAIPKTLGRGTYKVVFDADFEFVLRQREPGSDDLIDVGLVNRRCRTEAFFCID